MITSGQTVIGLVPTAIDGQETNPYRLTIKNNDNTQTLFLGNSQVTINNGFKVEKLETIQLTINPLELLYAVSSASNHVISWLKQTEN
jgi:hypothetical protein